MKEKFFIHRNAQKSVVLIEDKFPYFDRIPEWLNVLADYVQQLRREENPCRRAGRRSRVFRCMSSKSSARSSRTSRGVNPPLTRSESTSIRDHAPSARERAVGAPLAGTVTNLVTMRI
jgi:hypothetical protein